MPAGSQAKDRFAACAAVVVLATGCASSDPHARSLLEPVHLTLPGEVPQAPGADSSSRAQALADQAARDVAQLAGLGNAGDAGSAGVIDGIQWLTPAGLEPVNASPDRPAPARNTAARGVGDRTTGDPEPVLIGAFETLGPVAEIVPVAVELETHPQDAPAVELTPMLSDLSRSLYEQASASDAPMRPLLLIAATTMIDPAQALATEAIPGLTERERELLGMFQAFFTDLGERLETTGDPEVIVEAVNGLGQTLTAAPTLTIAKAALCTRVGGFGDYDEFATNEAGRYAFLAQGSQQAIVYVELVDFTSTLNDGGQWVTELAQQVVVYSDRDGIPVQRVDWQPGVDMTRNKRDDFFLVQIVTLADRLSVGRYQLKIRVRDEASSAEAETALDFELVADPQLASRR